MLSILFIACIIIFFIAYKTYGSFLSRIFNIDNSNITPANEINDGIDHVPTKPAIIFGHHFASIAGAGPIVGPIIASLYFGWLPVLLWIILGIIFIGALHDYSALVASVRHDGKSIAEIAKRSISKEMYYILLIFIIITLEYVLIVFADLTATTFVSNASVATSATGYILIALVFGIILYKYKTNLLKTSIPFIALLFVILYLGNKLPMTGIQIFGLTPKQSWQIIILGYCFIASILPMWLLLQPRDYLSSFLLYFAVIISFIGLLFTGGTIEFPAFIPRALRTNQSMLIFPGLFITVACGAVSGFHSLISSGTTAKQINLERDTKIIGYGGMLTEGAIAVIALAIVMMLPRDSANALGNPLVIFSAGIAKFLGVFGIKGNFASTIGLLIISTFILTTLDSATRIARYIFEELFNLKHTKHRFLSTAIVLTVPLVFIFLKIKDPVTNAIIPAWKAIWPVFGAVNQLMAALTFIVIISWLHKHHTKKLIFIKIPAAIMFIITSYALLTYIRTNPVFLIKLTSVILLLLSIRVLTIYFKKQIA